MTAFVLYVFLFTGSAFVLAWGTRFARTIHDDETRQGLKALLWTNAGWAAATAGYLVLPTTTLKIVAFEIGLVIGFATVWAWLYFCSAYTGRGLHRSRGVWRVCATIFVVVVATKITNPWHGLYFAATPVDVPFSHLAISSLPLYWISLGLAYCVAAAGYILLVDFFLQVKVGARSLGVLISITAGPLVLNVFGIWTPYLLNIPHDALGVAGFTLGLLFFQIATFEAAQWAGRPDAPTLVLDARDRVLNCNVEAVRLFPVLDGIAFPAPLRDVSPDLSDLLHDGSGSLRIPSASPEEPNVERFYAPVQTLLGTNAAEETRTSEAASPTHVPGGPHRQIQLKDVTDQQREREALAAAKRAAEDAARLKSSMLANMSHEVRTPLTSVLGFAEVLQDRLTDEEKDFADMIRVNSERLLETLDAVLQLSRLDAGARKLNAEAGDASGVVREVAAMLIPRAEAQGVGFDLIGAEHTIEGVFDRNALSRVVTNLAHNAIKFTPEGGCVRVKVQAHPPETTAPKAVQIDVIDTGIGMSETFLERATEPFRQESNGVRRDYEGTGLGLAITKQLVELMDGTLHFQSEKDEGTTASVTIPLTPPTPSMGPAARDAQDDRVDDVG